MKAVVQRVSEAEVYVAEDRIAAIGRGLVVMVGVEAGDGEAEADALAEKVARLRVFPGANKAMDKDILAVRGQALVVSQVTLVADVSKGHRPGLTKAARPEEAERLYLRCAANLREAGVLTLTGKFRADMRVRLVNDGPVTIVLDVPPGAGAPAAAAPG